MGERPFIGRPYKFSKSPLGIQGPAPAFGQDNALVLQELLGMDDVTYQALVQDVVIATAPLTGEPVSPLPQEQAIASGLLADWDPDYRERLGLS